MKDEKMHLVLHPDFFKQLKVKKMLRLPYGDKYLVVYIKMMLLAGKNDGYLKYDCKQEEFVEYLSLDLDEPMNTVAEVLTFLLTNELAETHGKTAYLNGATYIGDNICSKETENKQ